MRLKTYCKSIVALLGIAVVILGIAVLIGWSLELPILIQIFPFAAPMQTNTAICFIASGIALIALSYKHKALVVLASLFVLVVGFFTLLQYLFNADFGIDNFFREHYLTTKTSHPGRMAPNTALIFFLTGIVLLLSCLRRQSQLVNLIIKSTGILILFLALASVGGYLIQFENLYGWASYTRMAIHTSIGFVAIGSAITVYGFSHSIDVRNYSSAMWMSGFLGLMIAGLSIATWSEVGKQESLLIHRSLEEEGVFLRKALKQSFMLHFQALERMSNRWQFSENSNKERWLKDASIYLDDIPAIRRISFVSANGIFDWSVAEPGSALDEEQLRQLIRNLPDTAPQFYWAALPAANQVVFAIPILKNNGVEGFLAGVYDVDALIFSVLPESFIVENGLTVTMNSQVVIQQGIKSYKERWSVTEELEFFGSKWKIVFWPKELVLSKLPELILFFGTLLAIAITVIAELARVSRLRARQLAMNEKGREIVLQKLLTSELELSKSVKLLEDTNKDLEQFAYAASHDLKAPLHAIQSILVWLEEDLNSHLNPTAQKNITLINTRIQRMERLLDDLLDYSRIGKTAYAMVNEIVTGKELKEEVLGLLNIPEGFEVTFSSEFEKIRINEMPAKQILLNLISNGIKHHDKKQGSIHVAAFDEPNQYIFHVTDDGPGIAKKYQNQIFEMFQTLKPRDQVEGSGMGLSIVKKQVEVVGGTVLCESEEGKGCTFIFSLPKSLLAESVAY